MPSLVVYYDSDVPARCPSRPRSHLASLGRELGDKVKQRVVLHLAVAIFSPPLWTLAYVCGSPIKLLPPGCRPIRSPRPRLGVGVLSSPHVTGSKHWVVLPPRRPASEAPSRPAVVGTSLSSAGQSADSSGQRACLGFLAGGLLRLQCARPPLVSAREALASRQGQLRSTVPGVPDVGGPAAGEGAPRKRD